MGFFLRCNNPSKCKLFSWLSCPQHQRETTKWYLCIKRNMHNSVIVKAVSRKAAFHADTAAKAPQQHHLGPRPSLDCAPTRAVHVFLCLAAHMGLQGALIQHAQLQNCLSRRLTHSRCPSMPHACGTVHRCFEAAPDHPMSMCAASGNRHLSW